MEECFGGDCYGFGVVVVEFVDGVLGVFGYGLWWGEGSGDGGDCDVGG